MSAVPLVLLAGMNCTADLWAGCGLDDALTPVLDEESIDAQVERLLDTLPPVFALGGLSLGAIVAMALIARAPSRVAGLCLVSTNAKAPTDEQRRSWASWIDRLDSGESARSLQESIIDALLTPRIVADRPDLVARTAAMGESTGEEILRAQLRMQATRTDQRPGLRAVRVPTLVVSGAHDTVCPPSFHVEIANEIRGARAVSMDAGHLLPLVQPAPFGALVRSWRDRRLTPAGRAAYANGS